MNKNTVRELNQQIFELIELCIHNPDLGYTLIHVKEADLPMGTEAV